jgi:hypothetical protein
MMGSNLRKASALFAEFQETGTSKKLGYQTADDLRDGPPYREPPDVRR